MNCTQILRNYCDREHNLTIISIFCINNEWGCSVLSVQGYLFSPSKGVLDKSISTFNVVNNYQEVINFIDTVDILRQSHRYKVRNF